MDNIYVSPTEFAKYFRSESSNFNFFMKKRYLLPAYKNEKGYRFYLMSN